MITGTPFVAEGFRTYFSDRTILRSYLLVPIALAIVLLVVWPRGTVESVLRAGASTDCFSVVALGLLAFLLYLGGRYGSEDYSPDTLANLREYVSLTPVSIGSVVAGKAAFAVLHTIFMLALGAPFLLAALAVSGAEARQAVAALGVVAASTVSARMFGLFLLVLFAGRKLLRDTILLAGMAAYLLVTYLFLPAVSPIAALLGASAGVSALASLGAGCLLAVLLGALLALVRRGARAAGGTHG